MSLIYRRAFTRLLLTALFLCGAAPLSYGSVPPCLVAAGPSEAGSAVARGVGHAVTTEAVYGGKFEDVLKSSLISEASAAGFEFIGQRWGSRGRTKLTNWNISDYDCIS